MHALLLMTLIAIDAVSAQRAFAELDRMCKEDRGRLWGRSLCGPVVFADPRTREAVRNDGTIAKVPESIGIANTGVDWEGKRWTMVMWPLPQSVVARRSLMAHETFHRIQQDLGFPANNPSNAHLDTAEGRALMRLEWRALARALAGDESAIADALAFRTQRRALTPGAAEDERLLEMNEGVAEHTGYVLAVPHLRERIAPLVRKLANAEQSETFARSFAYTSGPAWGALIEMKEPRWTRTLKASDDLSELARRAWNVRGTRQSGRYGDDAVRVDEQARATKKRELLARLRAQFVDGPVLTIPLVKMQFTFDPNSAQPFESHGTVYSTLELRDVWGKIVVTSGGALISPDYSKLIVPANGEGYTVTLNDGWNLAAGAREGDKTLSQ